MTQKFLPKILVENQKFISKNRKIRCKIFTAHETDWTTLKDQERRQNQTAKSQGHETRAPSS